jgi:hypothetical protein
MRGWERAHTNSQAQPAAGRGGGRWRSPLTLAVVLGLLGALVPAAAPGAAQAADPTWSVVHSPDRSGPSYGSLSGVSCVSASSCFAVGNWVAKGAEQHTLAESWNGSSWKIVPSPDDGTLSSSLAGISCVSASFCVVVGSYEAGSSFGDASAETLVESWNGSAWSIVTSASQAGSLAGVSCVSASFCVAVGGDLIETWNGSTWSVVSSPGQAGNVLSAVSCSAADSCMAVGYSPGTVNSTLAGSWNGSTWSVVPSPSPDSGGDGSVLTGVSCISASSCTAVGGNDGNPATTLIETWNGSTWSVVTSPSQAGSLAGVSCVSASFCVAVGDDLIETWNGSTWSVASPSGADLSGVSCLSASACTAVGIGGSGTLVESWNGSAWSVVASPDFVSVTDSLNDVSCVSASFCVAVGSYLSSSDVQRTLIESWNGSTWSLVTSPDKFSAANVLNAVTCLSASFCVAVGSWANGTATLVESWNGSAWSIVASPNGSAAHGLNKLSAVSCTSASSCIAVGFWTVGVEGYESLAESWNGSTWSAVSTPDQGNKDLLGVSCVSASSCTAVGWGYDTATGSDQTLTESWNGTAWSIVSSPDQGTVKNALAGVTCLSATTCTAVGNYDNGIERTLVESWNGSAWSLVSSPNQGTGSNVLSGVSCAAASSCVAVGYYTGGKRTLVESWDGTAWSVVSSPSPGTGDSQLLAVSCLSAACTAAGDFTDAATGSQYPLIETSS